MSARAEIASVAALSRNDKPAQPSERVLIVGSGALACLFAARLSAAGAAVTMLGSWPAGLEALNRYGVRLQNPDGEWIQYPVTALPAADLFAGPPFVAAEAPGQDGTVVLSGSAVPISSPPPYRHALVLVKSWQTRRAAAQLSRLLAADGLALTLQNGLGNRERLVEALGPGRAAAGVTTLGASLLGPGQVRLAGEGPVTLEAAPAVQPLGGMLRQAGFQVENSSDLPSLQWGKLVINAAINPLTAVLDVPNGELLAQSGARSLLHRLSNEAAAVAAALNIRLPYADPLAAVEAVALRTARNFSSMLQDVRRGAPTEVDAINGAVVRAAEGLGLAAPFNRCLLQLVQAMEPVNAGL